MAQKCNVCDKLIHRTDNNRIELIISIDRKNDSLRKVNYLFCNDICFEVFKTSIGGLI